MPVKYSEDAHRPNPALVFLFTAAGVLLFCILLTLSSNIPYGALVQVILVVLAAVGVNFVMKYCITAYTYAITEDDKLVITKKVHRKHVMLAEIAIEDIQKVRPVAEGEKATSFCGDFTSPKYVVKAEGDFAFVFQPSEELLKRITGTTSA